jgi:hypothetical protein
MPDLVPQSTPSLSALTLRCPAKRRGRHEPFITHAGVMRGLDPRIHRLRKELSFAERWIAGSSPAMTPMKPGDAPPPDFLF